MLCCVSYWHVMSKTAGYLLSQNLKSSEAKRSVNQRLECGTQSTEVYGKTREGVNPDWRGQKLLSGEKRMSKMKPEGC